MAQTHSEHVHLRREVANTRRRQGSVPEGMLRRLTEAKWALMQAIEANKRTRSRTQMLVVTSALFPCPPRYEAWAAQEVEAEAYILA